ncbi:MAG: hypothetical protein IT178_07090 [Acidobacteria bacterium]|nr:hypothetical protein [Acidobacteriota bacterium]
MKMRALAVVAVMAWSAPVFGQSLADVARTEEARRKSVPDTGKVYTNDNLRPDFTKPTPPPTAAAAPAGATTPAADAAASTDKPADAPAAGPAKDQAYWSARITEARAQVERTRAFTSAIQNRIDMLTTDFVNRDDPAQRAVIEQDRIKALAELERLRRELDEQSKAIAAIEEEARRENVPPGWLRSPGR